MAKLIDGIDFNKIENNAVVYENTSLQSYGYGIISQYATTMKGLSLQAKGVYAYLIAFAGIDKQTYPSQKRMCYDLGIKKEDTLRKYIKELQATGLIKIYKTKKDNIHYKNVYVIADDTRTIEQWKLEYQEDNGIKEVKIQKEKPKKIEKAKIDDNGNMVFENKRKKSPTEPPVEDNSENNSKVSNINNYIVSNTDIDYNSKNMPDVFDMYVTNDERWIEISKSESIWNSLSESRKRYILEFANENKFYIPDFIDKFKYL